MPDVVEDFARVADEQRGEFAVGVPGAHDGLLIDGAAAGVEKKRRAGNEGLHFVHADIALALLLGIVKRMRVEKRPDELATDVFEAELKMRVLEDGVMA